MLQIVFNVFSLMFAKMSQLFCCFCILLFGTNNVCVVPCGVMRNLDAIIRVRMVLCETSMLLLVSVWCYAKLDAILRGSNYVRLNPGLMRVLLSEEH